jgi:3',5'-cyclic AMP phosphodiesterase CpdA
MRIAHLSDPHLLSLKGARKRDFFNKRWIGGLNLMLSRARDHRVDVFEAMVDDINASRVDHVVCTGDVTNVALPSEFRFARAHFDRFEHGAERATVIPGNHDAYVQAGVGLFAEHFGDYCAADSEWGWDDGSAWPVVRIRGHVAIVGLTTSQQTPWFTAWGRLGDAQVARLGRALSDPRMESLFRIVAIHHPPAGKEARHGRHGLKDYQGFADVLARTGADLVLHGHEHRDLRNEAKGPNGDTIPVRGIQSATYAGGRRSHRARYRIYTVDSERRDVAEELREWNPESGAFEAATRS